MCFGHFVPRQCKYSTNYLLNNQKTESLYFAKLIHTYTFPCINVKSYFTIESNQTET